MTTSPPLQPPSARQLLRATLAALVLAAFVLVLFVLPAEYGLDPTGAGRTLGLLRARPTVAALPAAADDPAGASATPAGGLLKRQAPFRSDEMSIALEPGEGGEIKAQMARGERFVFTWTAEGGPVDVDMHGEAAGTDGDAATSYWQEEGQTSGHGAFEAPVAGTHGWFWQNLGAKPVTIRVKTSGFYERLLRP